jgi:nitric oxide synthase oxygenase domain/subunit
MTKSTIQRRARLAIAMRSRIACRLFWKAFRCCNNGDTQGLQSYAEAMTVFLELNYAEDHDAH